MSIDENATAKFYSDNAVTYADALSGASLMRLDRFLTRLQPGAEVLELGCGNGRDSAEMIARGLRAAPTDGTPEMTEEASKRLGIPVGVLRFEDIDMVAAFDGVWANACLLHVPRSDLGGILAKIHTALRPGGVFYASFKAGEAEGHDGLGRFFNYPSKDWLQAAYEAMPWGSIEIDEDKGSGYDKRPTDWLHVIAVK
ncbi:class I SAM-dependent methyltransferase [Rhizobium sp. XQZ8]|uniref:class I SAM-dependent methyltransferase n=1 Tax=Rhizobium populisoli TaxID=2859785 RepID=UPI001C676D79|nr:class I SAM-dependent methyltransferase [Rhizobium populisoli]MBW6423377.1 class I SAM-dependent methyltransferase [Rhizobium populisoli]